MSNARTEQLRRLVAQAVKDKSLRIVADEVGVSHGTIDLFRQGGEPSDKTLAKVELWAARQQGGPDGSDKIDATDEPSFERMEWIPRLLERIISIPDISPMEKVRMMAEVNAAGMRYWAVSAEWAAGQRGMAMQEAERAGGERARATRTEAASARDRARTLGIETERTPSEVVAAENLDVLQKRAAAGHQGLAQPGTPAEGTPQKKRSGGES